MCCRPAKNKLRKEPPAARSALTLLELLVVIALISVLVGLLLAAIQRARDAAARVGCANNLKQLSLALHHFHDASYAFPTGYRSASTERQFTGWTLDILPFIELAGIYDNSLAAFRVNSFPFANPPHVHRATVVKLYVCTSDGRIQDHRYYEPTRSWVAFTSYLGVSGLDYRRRDGVLCRDHPVALAEITDGTTNTLLLGERPPSANFQFGWWYAGSGQRSTGSADIILGVREQNLLPVMTGSVCGPGAYPFQDSRFTDPCGMFHFWSPHAGGANFAFCDGSVRFLTYGANSIMPALASRAGGEVVANPP
jgi:prepilin-type processing-associated H-X9-DG protein